jgi:hypothetical protein
MDALAADEVFSFEGFRLDRRAGGLFRPDQNGVLVPVAIGSRALDLLILLVRRHGDLVSRDEIMSMAGSYCRGQQPAHSDLGAAPAARSGPIAGKLHPDSFGARLPLRRRGDAVGCPTDG